MNVIRVDKFENDVLLNLYRDWEYLCKIFEIIDKNIWITFDDDEISKLFSKYYSICFPLYVNPLSRKLFNFLDILKLHVKYKR